MYANYNVRKDSMVIYVFSVNKIKLDQISFHVTNEVKNGKITIYIKQNIAHVVVKKV